MNQVWIVTYNGKVHGVFGTEENARSEARDCRDNGFKGVRTEMFYVY